MHCGVVITTSQPYADTIPESNVAPRGNQYQAWFTGGAKWDEAMKWGARYPIKILRARENIAGRSSFDSLLSTFKQHTKLSTFDLPGHVAKQNTFVQTQRARIPSKYQYLLCMRLRKSLRSMVIGRVC